MEYDEVLIQEARENMRDLDCDDNTIEFQIEMLKDEGFFDIPAA